MLLLLLTPNCLSSQDLFSCEEYTQLFITFLTAVVEALAG